LKFVVDFAAGFDEMAWAQENVQVPLASFGKVYDAVRYRRDRIESRTLVWPKPAYRLPDILRDGGICVDQAYLPRWSASQGGADSPVSRRRARRAPRVVGFSTATGIGSSIAAATPTRS